MNNNKLKETKPTISKMETVQINSMENLNELPTVQEGEEDGINKTNETKLERLENRNVNSNEAISITDDNGKVYSFEKPEFECELKFVDVKSKIIGTINNNITIWENNGECYYTETVSGMWNLIPIKKLWCENPENFPAVVKHHNLIWIAYSKGEIKDARLATAEELLALYHQGK